MSTTTDSKPTGFSTPTTSGKTPSSSAPAPGTGPSGSPEKSSAPSAPATGAGSSNVADKTPASFAPAPGAGSRRGVLAAATKDELDQVVKAQELLIKRQDDLREKQELVVLRLVAKDILGRGFEKKTRRFVLDALVEHYDQS